MRESTRRKLFLIIICIQRWFLMALLNERTGISIDKHVYHVPCINPPSTKHCKPHWLTSRLHAYDNLKVYAATRKLLSELCIQKVIYTTHYTHMALARAFHQTGRRVHKSKIIYAFQNGLCLSRTIQTWFGSNAYENALFWAFQNGEAKRVSKRCCVYRGL